MSDLKIKLFSILNSIGPSMSAQQSEDISEAFNELDRLRAEVASLKEQNAQLQGQLSYALAGEKEAMRCTDHFKEQNALLTVQVQGLRDALEDLLERFDPRNHQSNCECDPSVGYQCAACKFPSIPAVGAAHGALTSLPQQVKSEDDDTALLNAIQENSWDLVSRTLTSGDDCEIGWQVIEHHMAKPYERVIGENFQDDARAAIRAAMSAQENKS